MGFLKSMKKIPSISNEINEDVIFKIISKNFSKIAPYWYKLLSSWLIRSYNVFQDIDKFIILIYFINKDLIFYRKNGLVIDYDTFYSDGQYKKTATHTELLTYLPDFTFTDLDTGLLETITYFINNYDTVRK